MKKKVEEMTIFKLSEYKNILKDVIERYNSEFASYGLNALIDESMLTQRQKDILDKRKQVQDEIERVEKLIEKKLFEEYV